jgi:hypothetical protein
MTDEPRPIFTSTKGTLNGQEFDWRFDEPVDQNGLSKNEALVMKHLCEAWAAFTILGNMHQDDAADFRHAIHACQNILGARVAARSFPGWRYPRGTV